MALRRSSTVRGVRAAVGDLRLWTVGGNAGAGVRAARRGGWTRRAGGRWPLERGPGRAYAAARAH